MSSREEHIRKSYSYVSEKEKDTYSIKVGEGNIGSWVADKPREPWDDYVPTPVISTASVETEFECILCRDQGCRKCNP